MMEDIYQKSSANAVVAQLTAVLSSETAPWDNSCINSKNIILNSSQCSEEHVLKCTFKACDPEQTGVVSVFRIIEYLQEMTGESCEDLRFQSLYKKLDPEERGVTVDFSTFYAVMKDWIADCRHEGQREEAVDLTNSIKDLQQGNKKLTVQNFKLQKTIEAAEELNAKLSEEMSELKGKLRSSQQALEQAKVMANELEDLKCFSKNLEEENNKLHMQLRQMEKEEQLISVQVDKLQEENKNLLLEKESSKRKIKELFTKMAKIKSQVSEYEGLLSCRDAALNEKTKQTENLKVTLDEYQRVIEELKLDISKHQDQQYYQDLDMLSRDSLPSVKACLQAPAQSLCTEIEESQKEFIEGDDLPSPLCGVLPPSMTHSVTQGKVRPLTEQVAYSAFPEIKASSSGEPSSEVSCQEKALVLVHGELIPTTGKKLNSSFFEILLQRFLVMQKLVLPGLLLACVLLLIMGCLVLPYSHPPVWIETKGNPWLLLQLQYIQPPPI